MDSLEKLRKWEKEVIMGVDMVDAGINTSVMALHHILSEKLYLAELDEKNLPVYKTQEDYLREFSSKVNRGRTTLFSWKAVAELAFGQLELTPQEFIEVGGVKTFNVLKDELGAGKIEDKALVVQKLKEMAYTKDHEMNLSPLDYRKEIKSLVGSPDVILRLPDGWNNLGEITWEFDGSNGVITDPKIPKEVSGYILRKLYLKGI